VLKIATWNVNSIRARLPHLLSWLQEFSPDVVVLQETKIVDADFPTLDIQAAGYHAAFHGQKSYNGVAILAKQPLQNVMFGLPGDDDDDQARYIEADIAYKTAFHDHIRICGLYLPNGNPVDTEKYPYKLQWMQRLHARAAGYIKDRTPFLMAGDYNVIPHEDDCYNPAEWREDALFKQETRLAFQALLNLGLTDGYKACHPHSPNTYSFWDYQRGAWQKDHGIRIDHLLLCPILTDHLLNAGIDKTPRGWQKASDHTPVWIELQD
jgi:exodeoxyribonuclease-3